MSMSPAKRIEARQEAIEKQMAKMKAQLDDLNGQLAMNDYHLAQQHGVKRIDNK